MIDGLKPYPTYRDSGLPWLGEIPAHWTTPRTKTCFRLSIEKSGTQHGKELLSIYTHIGVRPRKDLEERGNKATTTDDYWVVRKGDIICNKLLAWMGAIGVSHYDGVTSPAYDILRPISRVEPDYFHQLFRTPLYLQQFKVRSRGIMEMRLRLYFDQFGQIPLLYPPAAEQAAIVCFLDHVDRRIRRYLRAKRQLIALLNEQKQAIIHRAVTRGLDPHVRLKPSGVEWLGDMPEPWDLVRLKNVAKVQTGITLGKHYGHAVLEERPYLRVANVQTGRLDLTIVKRIAVPKTEVIGRQVEPGDVLMTEGGDIDKLGRGCVWRGEIEGCLHQNHIFAVRPDQQRLLPDFLVMLMGSRHGRCYFEITAKRTTNLASTNSTTLGEFPLPLPDMKLQRQILNAVSEETTSLQIATNQAEREIELLREYRTRLVADVVTGKLDVREAARQLPDEAEEPEPAEDGLLEGDESAEEAEDEALGEEVEA